MPLDRRAASFLRMLEAGRTETRPDIADRRRALRDLIAFADPAPDAVGQAEDFEIPGPAGAMPVRLYSALAASTASASVMLFLHGGGWTTGDLQTHDGMCRRLCNGWGGKLLALDYRLAPEHPFPAALDDAWAALTWLSANAPSIGGDASRLSVAGDSAGGGMAASLCHRARDEGGPAIALQLLICPILDPLAATLSRAAFADGYFLDGETMRSDLAAVCAGGADPSDPGLSPVRAASFCGLPPALIHTAEFDPFRDEAEAHAAALAAAGGAAELTRHEGLIHFFYALPGVIPAAAEIVGSIGVQAAAMLGRGPEPLAASHRPAESRLAEGVLATA
jgi:acetyl esterase/lipase